MKKKFNKLSRLLLLMVAVISFLPGVTKAQENRTVTGKVTDAATKITLPGVSVKVKGTANGASTNTEGTYSLQVKGGEVLVFSFIGYESKEVAVGTGNRIDVALTESAADLKEVVVTALGITRKTKSLTYATQQLNNSDLMWPTET